MKIKPLITSIIICFVPAVIGGIATSSSINSWYISLNKPGFNPPNWIFGPVWTILYLSQSISLYLIRTTTSEPVAKLISLLFFSFQLVLNLLWSVFFFLLRSPRLSLAEIGLLIITVIFTIISSYRVNRRAGLILLPYLAWISFAAYLNYAIVRLN